LPDRIRGYGPVKEKAVNDAKARYAQLAADLASPPPAPSQNFAWGDAIAVIPAGAGRVITSRKWGWEKADGGQLGNARSETVAAKPYFSKHADARRCLIPSDGFYESARGRAKSQPWRFTVKSTPVFGLAGLMNDEGSVVMLTTEPNACVRAVHPRMPVLLRPEAIAAWLDPRAPFVSFGAGLFAAWPAEDMCAHPPQPTSGSLAQPELF
jgi:putative SOS response-associated peptidase YedK